MMIDAGPFFLFVVIGTMKARTGCSSLSLDAYIVGFLFRGPRPLAHTRAFWRVLLRLLYPVRHDLTLVVDILKIRGGRDPARETFYTEGPEIA